MSSPPPPADSGAASALQLLQAHKHLRARQALLQDQPAHAAAHSGGDAALARLLATTAAVDELRADMADAGGWVLARQGGATTTYMQATPGASVARVRVEGWVDAPILSLLGVLYEVQLHHLWMPRHAGVGIRAGRMMHQFSPTAFWIEVDLDMPWPMSARRASLLVHGVDCLDAEPGRLRQVVILMKSVDDAAQLQADARGVYVAPGFSNLPSDAAPTTADGSVLVDVQLGGFVFTPAELNPQLGRTSGTFVQLVARADPRMAALPACALNIGIKHMAHFMLDAMSRMALRVQAGMPEYSTAMAANPQFYDFINQRMAEALQEVEEEVKASAERQRNMGRLNEEQSVEETMAKLELAMAEKEEEKKVVEDDEVVHDVVQQPAMVAAAAQ